MRKQPFLAIALTMVVAPVRAQVILPPQERMQAIPTAPPPTPRPVQGPVTVTPAAGGAGFALNLTGASLTEVIDILARQLKMNYILDPTIRGQVTINTYGELQLPDVLPLLETILRMNNAVAVKVGNLFHIVPSKDAIRLPIPPRTDIKDLPEDEQLALNLVALRYMTAKDMAAVLQPFLGAGAVMSVLDTGNLLLIEDNNRSMRRTMELLALFDNDTFAKQRVRLFEVKNSQASQLAKELEGIFAAYALSDKTSAIKFLPVERISSILVVSPNPNVFDEVKTWIGKLDQPVTVGGIQNFIYKVQYGLAEQLAGTLLTLYGASGQYGYGGYGGYESPYGGLGQQGIGFGGGGRMGGGGGFGGGRGGGGYGGMGGGGGFIQVPLPSAPPAVPLGTSAPAGGAAAPAGTDRTGTYLGLPAPSNQATGISGSVVRIVPDAINNLIIVQSTQQEWEVIRKTLAQLDLPPRQVLIEAQIYEVVLTDAFSSGVSAYLRQQGGQAAGAAVGTRKLTGFNIAGAFGLTIGHLIGQTRELAAFLEVQKSYGRTRVVSAPSIIATDNLAANINVGTEIPVLTSQGLVGGAQAAGTSLFTNTVSSRSTGVILNITARVNASGIVTLLINQEVSSPQAPSAGAIQSPSIQKRSVSTQVTVEDGSTIAIGGIMQENDLYSTARFPVLGKIPVLGAAFGSTSITKTKTELIILMTPRVIYDEIELNDMSDEIKGKLKLLHRLMKQ